MFDIKIPIYSTEAPLFKSPWFIPKIPSIPHGTPQKCHLLEENHLLNPIKFGFHVIKTILLRVTPPLLALPHWRSTSWVNCENTQKKWHLGLSENGVSPQNGNFNRDTNAKLSKLEVPYYFDTNPFWLGKWHFLTKTDGMRWWDIFEIYV